jgi:hypothetical protein
MKRGDRSADLRKRVLSLGVARVAREAQVPATTLYSFCQSNTRELAFKTAIRVEMAVESLAKEDGHSSDTVEEPAFATVPLFHQDLGFSRQFSRHFHPIPAAKMGDLKFEEGWLRAVGRKGEDWFFAIHVSGVEMADELRPGDHALVDYGDQTIWPDDDGIFLVNCDDRLTFARCQRAPKSPQKLSIEQAKRANPPIDPAALKKAMIVGRVKWFGRTLPVSKALF